MSEARMNRGLILIACRSSVKGSFCAMLQVPQFLYEAGYGSSQFLDRAGRIGVTQPRRVAAIAAAQRVAQELSTPIGATVGYQVRFTIFTPAESAMQAAVMSVGCLYEDH